MVRSKRVLAPKPIFDEDALLEFLAVHDVKPVHAGKIWRHMVDNLDCPLDEIPGIPSKIRQPLKDEFVAVTSTVSKVQLSEIDGTIKFLVRLQDGHEIECVLISHTGEFDPFAAERSERAGVRNTLCVSSQVGCRLKCSFCATGMMGLQADLLGGEIMEQFIHAKKHRDVLNVVFMGMGEPLENLHGVVSAVRGFTDTQRFGLAPRNVTVSTVGHLPNMRKFVEAVPQVKLAISLHAPNQKLREELVPSGKNWRIDALMQFVDEYAQKYENDGRRKGMIMISYVLIKNINDRVEHAQELAQLLEAKPIIINVIPFNSFEGAPANYAEPDPDVTDGFIEILKERGMRVFERRHHGRDIAAACGQLAKLEKGEVRSCTEVEDVSGEGIRINKTNPLARDRVRSQQPTTTSKRKMVQYLTAAVGTAVLAATIVAFVRRKR